MPDPGRCSTCCATPVGMRMPPRDDVRTCAIGHPGSDGGALVVGETGFLQKGRASAGVQQQYTGTAGRIEKSRAGVLPAYATDRGRALTGRRLCLPEHSRCCDPQRRRDTRRGAVGGQAPPRHRGDDRRRAGSGHHRFPGDRRRSLR
ncbi:hypothetical protein B5180_40460, partial [Streptomyces sp. BF-3]